MNRFFTISFITLALVTGATGAAPLAQAAAGDACSGENYNVAGTCQSSCSSGANTDTAPSCGSGFVCCSSTAVTTAADANTAANAAALKAAAANSPTDGKTSPAEGYNSVMQWIMSIFAWLVGVAALTLDTAVFYTVVTMGDYVHKLTAIGVAWRILRDIGNIMLIFGFLAIGISIILNTERLGWGKKMLPMLLVAAVFLNFSLFFTEAIIDTGNLFATQFYKQINGGNMPTAAFTASATVKNEGISNKLMAQLGLASLYNVNDGTVKKEIFQGSNPSIIGFLGILLFIITAFVMFSLAFILIARFVILIFLIILAPIGFAGLAVPQLAKKAGQWWAKLFQQTITAPVLLLLLYVALAVITDAQFLTGFQSTSGGWLGIVNNNNIAGFGGVLLSFLVAMGLLLAVTISAKSLSAFGADKATALAGKLSFGATAFGMRSTLGWGSQGAAQAIRRKYGGTKTGRLLATTLDKGAKASFDVRGATAFGGLKGMGVEAGDAQKGGYRKRREDAIKGHQDYIKSVGEAIDEKGISKENEAKITKAEEAKASAEEAYEIAQGKHEVAKKQFNPLIDQHQAEVDRLAEEARKNPFLGLSAGHTAKRDAAAQKLATNVAGLAVAREEENKTNSVFQAAIKEETRVGKEANKGITAEKKKAQLAYAENISGSFPGWVMYGPGGSAAAKKIVKDAKKSPDKILLDSLKKAIATGEKSDTPAPAVPAPAATKP